MAEQTMLSLSAYATNPSLSVATPTNYAKAIAKVNNWWQTRPNTEPPVLTNGSGLCRDCSLTADNLAELLSYAYQHSPFDDFVNSLGVAGIDGSIQGHKWRMPNSAAIGHAWIKTGTLAHVTAMAGFVKGRSLQDYVVVGIINTDKQLNTNAARRVLDTMLDWTAQH